MARNIEISLQLEVIAGLITIPGCEAPSAFSSSLLARYRTCCSTTISLEKALEAIPGSYVKLQFNTGEPQGRRRWYILPATDIDCPCTLIPDYYKILREAACDVEDIEIPYDCETIDMGYCPPKNLNDTPIPPTMTYRPESAPSDLSNILIGGSYLDGPIISDPYSGIAVG